MVLAEFEVGGGTDCSIHRMERTDGCENDDPSCFLTLFTESAISAECLQQARYRSGGCGHSSVLL